MLFVGVPKHFNFRLYVVKRLTVIVIVTFCVVKRSSYNRKRVRVYRQCGSDGSTQIMRSQPQTWAF